mmetsp:Transcript_117722/g.344840  ORF Transcript_117722/g.344840 Transcript_117722/m.344840 type:complete len:301 (+) Transcript_117722:1529-2431(+)
MVQLAHNGNLVPNDPLFELHFSLDRAAFRRFPVNCQVHGAEAALAQEARDVVHEARVALRVLHGAVGAGEEDRLPHSEHLVVKLLRHHLVQLPGEALLHVLLLLLFPLLLFLPLRVRHPQEAQDLLQAVAQHGADEAALAVRHRLDWRCLWLDPTVVDLWALESPADVSGMLQQQGDSLRQRSSDGVKEWRREGRWPMVQRMIHPVLCVREILKHLLKLLDIDLLGSQHSQQRVRALLGRGPACVRRSFAWFCPRRVLVSAGAARFGERLGVRREHLAARGPVALDADEHGGRPLDLRVI